MSVTPSAIFAIDLAVISAIHAAAATVTFVPPFSPLFASGVPVEPEPVPAEFCERVLPWPRFASALSLTVGCAEPSPSVAPLPLFSFAPAELAAASVTFADEPSAVKLTLPPAVRSRSSCESTRWLTTASASESPMPALPPFVAPFAFVVTDAVCVASAWSAPPIVIALPVPTVARS